MVRIRTVSAAGAAPDITGVRPEMSGRTSGTSDGSSPLACWLLMCDWWLPYFSISRMQHDRRWRGIWTDSNRRATLISPLTTSPLSDKHVLAAASAQAHLGRFRRSLDEDASFSEEIPDSFSDHLSCEGIAVAAACRRGWRLASYPMMPMADGPRMPRMSE